MFIIYFQGLLAEYQNKLCVLAQEENALGRLLKEYGKQDRNRAGKMMTAVGKSLSYTAQQRVALRNPLVRLYQEVDTFHSRAVEDTLRTVTEMEKIRTEYRGALMWMKNISQDFNPDQYHQLEKFREVQSTVKQKKANFDKIKIKSLQKTDLLAASRCNMFSHALILYQNNLITFSEKTAKTLNSVANNFKGYHPYEFQVIKELAEPALRLSEEEEEEEDKNVLEGDDKTFFGAEYHDETDENKQKSRKAKTSKKVKKKTTNSSNPKKSDSLINLLDISTDKQNDSSEQNNIKDKAVDLLTNNPEVPDTEKDTQQMLKELFDSPVKQPLPVFGTDIPSNSEEMTNGNPFDDFSNAFQLPTSQGDSQKPENIFLPSQLLDFGMQNWTSSSSASTIPTFQATIPDTTNLLEASGGGETSTDVDNSKKRGPSSVQKKGIKSNYDKVDWYKVFQDIDPLSDPASSLFGKLSDEEKQC